jgi:hypothetical protein
MEHLCSDPVPTVDALARDRSVRRSLSSRSDYLLIGASLAMGAVLCAAICMPERIRLPLPVRVDLGKHALRLALPIAVFPLLVMLVGIGAVLTPWRCRLEQQWLRRLPFPFAHRGYLLALKRDSGANPLELLLTFNHPPDQKDFEQLSKSRFPRSKLIWQDEACVLVRSPLDLGPKGSYARGVYNNAPVHAWFRRVAAPFLIDLHRKAGLKKVEIRT